MFNLLKHRKIFCVGCKSRCDKTTMKYVVRNAGLCEDCVKNMEFTHQEDTFFGGKHVTMVISPLFYTGVTKKLLIDLKFHNARINAHILNKVIKEYMRRFLIFDGIDMVMAVPLSKERLKERGFNQAHYLADEMSNILGKPNRSRWLKRIRNTKKQSVMQGVEKIKNVENAFVAKAAVKGKNILLTDDICTTRSTLEECAAALKAAGAHLVTAITYSIHKPKEEKEYIPELWPVQKGLTEEEKSSIIELCL